MFGWFKRKLETSDPLSWFDADHFDLTRSVYFRVPDGPLRESEIDADNEDVPTGIPILQSVFYSYHPAWTLHDLHVSAWHHSATASVGRDENVLFLLDLREWNGGWMLTVCQEPAVSEPVLRNFLSQTHESVCSLPNITDVRWFPDHLLRCGVFHHGDFELGLVTPDRFCEESTEPRDERERI